MYLLNVLVLLLTTWCAPALAIRPQWLASSRTVVAVPIVSVAVVGLSKAALDSLGHYDTGTVRLLAAAFTLLAAARVAMWLRTRPALDWPRTHCVLLGFAVLLGLSWAARLGTTGFDTNDEIYSWNVWAMQHALGEKIDLFYTRAPYPQLFAVLVSWKYQLLGDFELQLPLRASLAMIPVVLWGAIAVAAPGTDRWSAWRSLGVMVLLAIAIGRWFGHGLADPLMAASLVAAVHCYLHYRAEPERAGLLLLSVVCAVVAQYSKQPALIWGLFSFPALVLLDVLRKRVPLRALLAPAVTLSLGLAWVFGAGSGFVNNEGVIEASLEDRSILGQVGFAIRTQLLGQPLALLLLLAAAVAVIRARRNRDIALLFLLPALVAWLGFGAYSLRLGIHVVACAALLVVASGFALPPLLPGGWTGGLQRVLDRHRRGIAIGLVVLVLLGTLLQAQRKIERIGPTFSIYTGGANTIALYFGEDADEVLEQTYRRPDRLLWVPSNYLWGLYYHRTPMVRAARLSAEDYTPDVLLAELERTGSDFAFDPGEIDRSGGAALALRSLASRDCPELFEVVASPPNRYGYILYRVRDDAAAFARCRATVGAGTPAKP